MIARNKPGVCVGAGLSPGFTGQNRRNFVRVHVSYRAFLRARAFRPNMRGYIFQKGLSDIRRAYDATIMALESNRAKLVSDLSDFQRAVSVGEASEWEYDEDGEMLYSHERVHELLIEDAASTITVAREAYVVVLHHYWEKRCKEWMCGKAYKFCKAYKYLQTYGLAVDRSNLEMLRSTCNEIRHGNQPPNPGAHDVDRMFEAVMRCDVVARSGMQELQTDDSSIVQCRGLVSWRVPAVRRKWRARRTVRLQPRHVGETRHSLA